MILLITTASINPPQVSPLLLRDGFRARAYFAKLLLSSLATAMSSSYQKTRLLAKRRNRHRDVSKKRVRAELDTEEGDVEMYLVKFPTKVTEYLRAQGGAAGGNPKPLVLGNFNIGPDGGAYLKLSNDVSNDLKGIDGIRMNKKIRAQPERIFWVNRDRSKVRLKGYIKHQYRGQYAHHDFVKTSTVKQSEVPEKASLAYVKGNPELNATANRNIAIPDEVLASTTGKRGVVETQTAESMQSRMRNTERLSREDVKRKLLEFFEERMEKGKVGWKKKELSGLINVQEKLFLEVLSEIAHFDKSKQLWVLKEGNVHT